MNGPKEGIYLEATLAVIGEQVDERIDELARRRTTRRRWGIAALSLVTIASGSVAAAVAMNAAEPPAPPAVALTAEHELRCVEGDDAGREAYFTLRYRTAEGEPTADEARLCAAARSTLAADPASLAAATPDELIEIAEELVASAITKADATVVAPVVVVSDAAFGRLAGGFGVGSYTACEQGTVTTVLARSGPRAVAGERALLCARASR